MYRNVAHDKSASWEFVSMIIPWITALGKREASLSYLNLHDVLSLARGHTPLSFSGEVVIVDGAPLCRNGKQVLLLRSLESTE